MSLYCGASHHGAMMNECMYPRVSEHLPLMTPSHAT